MEGTIKDGAVEAADVPLVAERAEQIIEGGVVQGLPEAEARTFDATSAVAVKAVDMAARVPLQAVAAAPRVQVKAVATSRDVANAVRGCMFDFAGAARVLERGWGGGWSEESVRREFSAMCGSACDMHFIF